MLKLFLMFLATGIFNLYAQNSEVKVKIDNKEVHAAEEYTFNRDESLKFQAEGLLPKSEVLIKVKKSGVALIKETHLVEKDGTIFEVLDTPDLRMSCACEVFYTTKSGLKETIKFKLHFR